LNYDPRSHGDYRDILANVSQIRRYLTSPLEPINITIEFHCYNRAEVEETKARLTEEERKHARFFWLTWPQQEQQLTPNQ
jgi:hypothetical protein